VNDKIIAAAEKTGSDLSLRSGSTTKLSCSIHRYLTHHVSHRDTQVMEITAEIYHYRQTQRMENIQKRGCHHHRRRRNTDGRKHKCLSISIAIYPPLPEKASLPYGLNSDSEEKKKYILIQISPQKNEKNLRQRRRISPGAERLLIRTCRIFHGHLIFRLRPKEK
jgi:hypothetical protein